MPAKHFDSFKMHPKNNEPTLHNGILAMICDVSSIFFSIYMAVMLFSPIVIHAQDGIPQSQPPDEQIAADQVEIVNTNQNNSIDTDQNNSIDTDQNNNINREQQQKTYSVKKHDTLWNISAETQKNPEKWPAVWGMNRHITNPHWIYPGDTIYLDQQRPGSLKSRDSNAAGTLNPLSNAPTDVIPVNPPYHFFYPLIDTVGYIKPEPAMPMGKIIACKPRFQKKMQQGTEVYLQMVDESTISVGDQFQLIRTINLQDNAANPLQGVQHYITGIIEISRLKLKPCKCQKPMTEVEGKIVTAYRTILPDDLLVPYNSRDSRIAINKSNVQLTGTILFSEEHNTHITENAVVFINRGKIHGLKTGQYYDIFNRPKGKEVINRRYIEKTEYIGSLVVLSMEVETSAALITYAYKTIAPGDLIFPPM